VVAKLGWEDLVSEFLDFVDNLVPSTPFSNTDSLFEAVTEGLYGTPQDTSETYEDALDDGEMNGTGGMSDDDLPWAFDLTPFLWLLGIAIGGIVLIAIT
jgi:hypothetical protein